MNDPASQRLKSVGGTLVLLALIIAVGATVATILIARPHDSGQLRLADRGSGGLRLTLPEEPGQPVLPGATKSTTPTAAAETTASATATASAAASTSANATVPGTGSIPTGAGGSNASGDGDVSDGGSASGEPGPGDAGTSDPNGTAPSPPGGPGPDEPLASVGGQVTHAVWGTPLAGVPVTLEPAGVTAVTASDGRFGFPPVVASGLLLVAVDAGSGWRSQGGTMRSLALPDGGHARADFALYGEHEAYGTDWRSAAEWSASGADLDRLLPKVRAASTEFAGVGESGARAVLAGVRGSAREKARAELLASWLDLASARLGFETPVDPSRVAGAGGRYGGASTALELVRQADHAIATEDADWTVTRRVLTDRALAYSGASDTFAVPEPENGPKQKRRPGLD